MSDLINTEEKTVLSTAVLSTSSQSPPLQNITKKNEEAKARNINSAHATTSDHLQRLAELNTVAQLVGNVNIVPNNRETKQEQVTVKGKNSRKKKNRHLSLNTNINSNNVQHQIPVYGSPNTSSVHDFFGKPVNSPLPNAGARYIENMQHHPQFQYMQNVQTVEMQQRQQAATIPISRSPQMAQMTQINHHATSVPNTPLIQYMQQRTGSVSIPCSPLTNPQLNMHYNMQNMFLQNIMQHPLLSQTYNNMQTVNQHSAAAKTNSESPKKKRRSNDAKNFYEYLSLEEVEEGLKNKTLIEGIIRINPKQFQHAFISGEDRDEQDVFIDGLRNRNRALEGDVVIVQLIESDSEESQDNETDASKEHSKKRDNHKKDAKSKNNTKQNRQKKDVTKQDDQKKVISKQDNQIKNDEPKHGNLVQDDSKLVDLKNNVIKQDDQVRNGSKQNDQIQDGSQQVDVKKEVPKHDQIQDGSQQFDLKNDGRKQVDLKNDGLKLDNQIQDGSQQVDLKKDGPKQVEQVQDGSKQDNQIQDGSQQVDLEKNGLKHDDQIQDVSQQVDSKKGGPKQVEQVQDGLKQDKQIQEVSQQVDLETDGPKQENQKKDDPHQDKQNKDFRKSDHPMSKQRRGRVVYIKEKVHKRTCIGNLKLMPDKNRQKALFIPRDHRIPRLNIPFTCWPDNFYNEAKSYENTLFLAKIVEWSDTRFAIGKILTNIGQSGNMVTETMAILAQNDLDVTPFGPEVRDLFPRLDYTIPEEEIAKREDCRKLCIFSIDPNNCRDIDDAISCRELDNGNYEIGVHISDVAHYLTENTILDEKVAEKATTIYLVEKAYHMLPDELCMLCSLFPGVDKLAFSVFWEITKDGEVLSHSFAKTVINSCCQLAYDHAQAILDDSEDAEKMFPETYNGFKFSDIQKSIKIVGGMAAKFRKNRFDGGALRIDQVKVSFHLSPSNGLPESFEIYENKESHQMIEEFMLLANMTVAQRIYEDHPQLAFLRCHPPPSGFMLKQLVKSLKPMGIELDIASAGHLHRSLLPYIGPGNDDQGRALVLNMLCAKPMARAKYFCAATCEDEDFHHYALNVPLYTHFTSPIRRYADIMVHRLLAASLNYRDTPQWEIDYVRMVAAQCNKQKYNSKKASEMSSELYMLKYIEMNSPFTTEAVVVDVREKYIDVIIIAMGLNRRIFFNNDFPGEFNCIKHEGSARMSKMELKWQKEDGKPEVTQVIEVFSILTVQLHKGDDMVKVETKLIRPQ